MDLDDTTAPSVWVQWKGTELCADFRCECGAQGHIDDGFCYAIECNDCSRTYTLPRGIRLIPGNDGHDPRPVNMDTPTTPSPR